MHLRFQSWNVNCKASKSGSCSLDHLFPSIRVFNCYAHACQAMHSIWCFMIFFVRYRCDLTGWINFISFSMSDSLTFFSRSLHLITLKIAHAHWYNIFHLVYFDACRCEQSQFNLYWKFFRAMIILSKLETICSVHFTNCKFSIFHNLLIRSFWILFSIRIPKKKNNDYNVRNEKQRRNSQQDTLSMSE